MFTDRSGNVIGDDDAGYDDVPDDTADLPGEVIPEVAPDAIDITGVDEDNTAPVPTDRNDSTGVFDLNDSTGVAAPTQTVAINDVDMSPPPEPALVADQQPRRSGRDRKATERYVPSLSGKSYNYTQLGLSTPERGGASYNDPTVPESRIETMGRRREDSRGGRSQAASLAQLLQASTLERAIREQARPNPQVACLRQEEAIWANQGS